MKILILANDDVGLYKFRRKIIEKLIEENHKVYVSLPDGDFIPELQKLGVTFIETAIERRGMNPLKDFGLIRHYRRVFKDIRPDKVITYTIKPNIYGGIVARLQGCPCYINITGLGTAFQKNGFIKQMVVCFYKAACRKAEIVFFENSGNQKVFLDEKIISKEKTFVLPGAGVDIGEYTLTAYPKEEKISFLFVGRVMREKGIEELLFAITKLYREGYKDKMTLDIVGPCEEQNYTERLKQLESEGILRYHGFQADVKPFIKRCHCFVLPSYHEGMANTLLEAGSMGRPLITSDIHGCKEALNGKNGFSVIAGNGQDLYEKMKRFLQLSNVEMEQMGMESYNFIVEHFAKDKVVEKTMDRIFRSEHE